MSLFSIFALLAGTLMTFHAVEEAEKIVVVETIEDEIKPICCILHLNGLKRGVMSS